MSRGQKGCLWSIVVIVLLLVVAFTAFVAPGWASNVSLRRAQPTPWVIDREVPVEKVVIHTVEVEKQVPINRVVKETVIVEKEVAVEKVVKETVVVEKKVEVVITATPTNTTAPTRTPTPTGTTTTRLTAKTATPLVIQVTPAAAATSVVTIVTNPSPTATVTAISCPNGEATTLDPQGELVNGVFSVKDLVAPNGFDWIILDGRLPGESTHKFLVLDSHVSQLSIAEGTWYAVCGDPIAIAKRIAAEKAARNPGLSIEVRDRRSGKDVLVKALP